jgi:prepilin-type N-terminal cleavage/methylation domain-containing protein
MGIRGLNLIELIVVVIVLAVLITIAIPAYQNTQERALDKEAIASLKLIRSAEIGYNMDMGKFYPESATTESSHTNINNSLKMYLPTPDPTNPAYLKWNYSIINSAPLTAASGVTLKATRNGGDGRCWSMTADKEEPGPCP